MMAANSPNAKYLAGGCALVAILFAPGIVSEGGISILPLAITLGAFVATFYFLGRTFTETIVTYSWYRRIAGFLVAGTGIMIWTYSHFVFGIDLDSPALLSRIVVVAIVGFTLVGLAHVGWVTGCLGESLAIKRTRGNYGESPR